MSDVGKDNFLLFITNINLISALKLEKNKIDALSFLPNLTRKFSIEKSYIDPKTSTISALELIMIAFLISKIKVIVH